MLKNNEILETISMIKEQNLDVRTITLGLSLMDCACEDVKVLSEKIYDKITKTAENLVKTGENIEKRFGIPIINKRISVTPISIVAASCNCNSYLSIAKAMDKAAKEVGVDFIGGFSALVHKGFTESDLKLIKSLPESLANTDIVCSSVNIGSTRYGINMDAVKLMGETIKETSLITPDGFGCAKLVVFCNAVEDNPFMAGAFHGVGEAEKVINVGVSGPGVVKKALEEVRGKSFEEVAETIKKTSFKVTRMGQL
ncbi:MAG: DUF711 family protein, partial [Clostridium perfringens]|nr:DUF711 family protein [Clostridium perfringens]